jgi:hypothetical protein
MTSATLATSDNLKVAQASRLPGKTEKPSSVKTGAAGTAALPFTPFDKQSPVAHYGRYLPHWRQSGATYFVTFRLADSIPAAKLRQWEAELDEWMEKNPEPHSDAQRAEYH